MPMAPALGVELTGVQRGLNQIGCHFLRGALLLVRQQLQRVLQIQVEGESCAPGRAARAVTGAAAAAGERKWSGDSRDS